MQYQFRIYFLYLDDEKALAGKNILEIHCLLGYNVKCSLSDIYSEKIGRSEMKTFNKNALKIRRMVSSDITPTLGIWWANIPEKEKVADQLRDLSDLSFIAEYEGTLVGFILAKMQYSGFPMTGAGVAFLIEVHPDYQRSGIGTMLINALEKYCASKGINTVRAIIPKNDKRMIKYFVDKGFSESNVVNYDKPCSSK